MNERQLWQLFLETGAPEVYLEYRQEHTQAEMGLSPSANLYASAGRKSALQWGIVPALRAGTIPAEMGINLQERG